MEWVLIVVLVVAVPIILFPVAYLWYLNIGGIYAAIKQAQEKRAASERGERRLRVSATTARRMRWAIGLTLGLPILLALLPLLPVALVWYINASGLYSVLRATRQRQKRRAEAVRAAEEIARDRATVSTAGKEEGQLAEAGVPRWVA